MTIAAPSAESIAARLAAVRARIEAACERSNRDPRDVTLIAVSKTWPAVAVAVAFEGSVRDFGENRVQEGAAKAAELRQRGIDPTWHLVGHLQRNKVREALGTFAILHAVESERLLEAIDGAAKAPVRVMVEVNVAGEATKFGVTPDALPALLSKAARLPGIQVEGLMTVAPRAGDPELVRPVFRTLRELARRHSLPALSMGMTGDYEVAIEEGATHIRIGRAIFGERT